MARNFNGTSDVINLGTVVAGNNPGYTFSCWLNSPLSSSYGAFACFDFTTFADGSLKFYLKSNGKTAIYTSGGAAWWDGSVGSTLSANIWYHLLFAVSFDITITQYLNGVADGSGTHASNPSLNGTSMFGYDLGNRYGGNLADCALWNVVLTAGEIAALARGIRPHHIRRQSLCGYWPLDGISSPEPDLSGLKINGTLTGTTNAAGPPLSMFSRMTSEPPDVVPSFIPAWQRASNLPVIGAGTF